MLTPFFTDKERREVGCQHRLFFSQVEYCDNLIFYRRAGIEQQLTQRLLDVNRNDRSTEKDNHDLRPQRSPSNIRASYRPSSKDLDLPNPVIRSHYGHGFLKQYVRDDRLLRTEPATNSVYDYGVNKDVENLPQLREKTSVIIDNYHNAQQDILETFVDRGQAVRKLAEPTVLANGKRIPGLKLDHPRQLAVMHALVRFANIAAGGSFTTSDLYAPALDALGLNASKYSLASLRYDLSKLRAKGLVEKVPRSRRYRLVGKGYSICLVFRKLYEKIYAPLRRGSPAPLSPRIASWLKEETDLHWTKLYQSITSWSRQRLLRAIGLKDRRVIPAKREQNSRLRPSITKLTISSLLPGYKPKSCPILSNTG